MSLTVMRYSIGRNIRFRLSLDTSIGSVYFDCTVITTARKTVQTAQRHVHIIYYNDTPHLKLFANR